MPDYPSDLTNEQIDSIMGRSEDISDFAWWAEKTQDVAVRYCPVCEPERDPLKEVLDPFPCSHHEDPVGADDKKVKAKKIYPLMHPEPDQGI